jgi:hypothetical protein
VYTTRSVRERYEREISPVWLIQNQLPCGNKLALIYGVFHFFILKMNLTNNICMHVGTSCEEVGLSNIISLDILGPLSFMFNRTINTDAIYCTMYVLVTHTISCAVCTAGFV